jgi:hypothetical protein
MNLGFCYFIGFILYANKDNMIMTRNGRKYKCAYNFLTPFQFQFKFDVQLPITFLGVGDWRLALSDHHLACKSFIRRTQSPKVGGSRCVSFFPVNFCSNFQTHNHFQGCVSYLPSEMRTFGKQRSTQSPGANACCLYLCLPLASLISSR